MTKHIPVKDNVNMLPSKSNMKSYMQNSVFIPHLDITSEHVGIETENKTWGDIWR